MLFLDVLSLRSLLNFQVGKAVFGGGQNGLLRESGVQERLKLEIRIWVRIKQCGILCCYRILVKALLVKG